MTDPESSFGPYPYGHQASEMFTDVRGGVINFEYFRRSFEAVALPLEIARFALGDLYSQYGGLAPQEAFVKFLPLSTLATLDRLLPYQAIADRLVDHCDIDGFELAGPLSMWGGEDIYRTTPCVFISHRWQAPDHPDPDGTHLALIVDRLRGKSAPRGEIYLWIDYCCLPQRTGGRALAAPERQSLERGLIVLPDVVKSCDLMIVDSPDYFARAWCYAEMFVWLCKLAEVSSTRTVDAEGLVQSVLTSDFPASGQAGHQSVQAATRNVRYRGFTGSEAEVSSVFGPVRDYCGRALDSAAYNLGAYENEYLPELVSFMCSAWHALRQKAVTEADDLALCLRAIVEALRFANTAVRPAKRGAPR